jgi:hypothetical protein
MEIRKIVSARKTNGDVESIDSGLACRRCPDRVRRSGRSTDGADLAIGAGSIARRRYRQVDIVVLIGKLA